MFFTWRLKNPFKGLLKDFKRPLKAFKRPFKGLFKFAQWPETGGTETFLTREPLGMDFHRLPESFGEGVG